MVSGDEIATVSEVLNSAKNREKSAFPLLNAPLMHRRNLDAFTFDSSHRLKRDSNFTRTNTPARSQIGQGKPRWICVVRRAEIGEAKMARYEVNDGDIAVLGEANASGDVLFQLGMMYSTGSSVPTDYVTAHKWFNLAAMRGNKDAIRLRREISEQMSESEIATAQRAARDWLRH